MCSPRQEMALFGFPKPQMFSVLRTAEAVSCDLPSHLRLGGQADVDIRHDPLRKFCVFATLGPVYLVGQGSSHLCHSCPATRGLLYEGAPPTNHGNIRANVINPLTRRGTLPDLICPAPASQALQDCGSIL